MVSPVSPPQVRAPSRSSAAGSAPTGETAARSHGYAVKISVAAQALQEATETQAQTTKEAGSGDVQARRLLAQQAADGDVTK
jgi:hypothetical protein